MAALRAQLQAAGDFREPLLHESPLQDERPAAADVFFDEELDHAVRSWQRRHGLKVDGLVGPKTLATLNVPVQERIRRIERNLERWQRDEQERGERYLLINIPAFSLDVIEYGQSVMRMRVIVGKPEEDWRTPVFRATMRYLVLSPYWQIPPNIAEKEILPRVIEDPTYLTRNRMQVVQGWGKATRTIDASAIDWTTVTPEWP